MQKRSIYFIGVLALFAIVIVGSASAFDLNSLFGDSSASEPQQISIEGINFTIPEGYTEEVNGSMDNEKLSAGSLTYTVNGKSFVNLKTQDAAAIIVADYGDYNVLNPFDLLFFYFIFILFPFYFYSIFILCSFYFHNFFISIFCILAYCFCILIFSFFISSLLFAFQYRFFASC